jgi:hypothetical protein
MLSGSNADASDRRENAEVVIVVLPVAGGSATELSVTDAWLRFAADDGKSLCSI